MTGLKIPKFQKGSILTMEMLEALKDLSFGWARLEYKGYANGILLGCEVTMSEDVLYVQEGILIYKEEPYFIQEKVVVPYQWTEGWQTLKVQIEDHSSEKNFREGKLQVILTEDMQPQDNTIELCRFYLQQGAVLRNEHRNFNDFATNYDTVNEIYANWSAYGEPSVSIRLLKKFAEEAQKKNSSNMQDILLIQQIKNAGGKTITRESLIYYLNTRLNDNKAQYTNLEIYEGLQKLLKEMQCETTQVKREIRNRRMIVE